MVANMQTAVILDADDSFDRSDQMMELILETAETGRGWRCGMLGVEEGAMVGS